MSKCNALFMDEQEAKLRKLAEELVARVGYGIDSPGYEVCV